ncbi:MAG: hypothetical protein EA376_14330 [Phycisphaeraceae bacterium]|nr:MAG: hypothetical protein EA376_14330 [Phycisphaeraceae bacterium]
MKTSRRHTGLLALNAGLLLALGAVTLAPIAEAQRGATQRARGDYTMVAGRVVGVPESAIYIIDSTNQELVGVRWDRSRRMLQPIGFRDIQLDARGGGGAR